jgi:hypothetical protein
MNIHDLTLTQLKRAVAIKEQISKLGDELRGIFDGVAEKIIRPKKRTMSAPARRKIAAAQRASWAKLRRNSGAAPAAKPVNTVVKKTNASVNARRSAKLKAYWAAKKKAAKR